MRIILNMTTFLLIIVSIIFSCATNRVLKLDNLPKIDSIELIGLYEWRIRDHHVTIKLLDDGFFRYEFSNSFENGHYKGAYVLNGNFLTLKSDSLISQKWTDILIEQNNKIKSFSDSSIFEFVITKEGLHEKIGENSYGIKSTFKKIK